LYLKNKKDSLALETGFSPFSVSGNNILLHSKPRNAQYGLHTIKKQIESHKSGIRYAELCAFVRKDTRLCVVICGL
jgi:hypothetical protein